MYNSISLVYEVDQTCFAVLTRPNLLMLFCYDLKLPQNFILKNEDKKSKPFENVILILL